MNVRHSIDTINPVLNKLDGIDNISRHCLHLVMEWRVADAYQIVMDGHQVAGSKG